VPAFASVFETDSVMDCKLLVDPQPSMLTTSNAQANALKRV
jgi:hypothetical protein